ncbi:MAG: glycosyltransferase, partial [Candidatus Acidiferrales bacterium]
MTRAYLLFAIWLISLGMLCYVYHGYFLVLRVAAWVCGRPTSDQAEGPLPSVSLLLTVHNEQERVDHCLTNLLALDYDRDRLEILVASDGSTDRTNQIVEHHAAHASVRLLAFERLGKSEAQNQAIRQAHGEIIAFTDADCMPAREYLRELVRPFADKQVGCVTGRLRIT